MLLLEHRKFQLLDRPELPHEIFKVQNLLPRLLLTCLQPLKLQEKKLVILGPGAELVVSAFAFLLLEQMSVLVVQARNHLLLGWLRGAPNVLVLLEVLFHDLFDVVDVPSDSDECDESFDYSEV